MIVEDLLFAVAETQAKRSKTGAEVTVVYTPEANGFNISTVFSRVIGSMRQGFRGFLHVRSVQIWLSGECLRT